MITDSIKENLIREYLRVKLLLNLVYKLINLEINFNNNSIANYLVKFLTNQNLSGHSLLLGQWIYHLLRHLAFSGLIQYRRLNCCQL